MENMKIHAIYFSPSGTTKTIVETVARGISNDIIKHDITQGVKGSTKFTSNDIAIIGVPSFAGRVPKLASEFLSKLKSNNAKAILVCSYGNRDYEDTLIELNQISSKQGFKVISRGAFIARHSIFPAIAKGRPDQEDLKKANEFGIKSLEIIKTNPKASMLLGKGSPLKEAKKIPLKIKANSDCTNCGICATLCPVNAIDKSDPKKTDKELCLTCTRCIFHCPKKARKFSGLKYKAGYHHFLKKYSDRKEIELFYTQ